MTPPKISKGEKVRITFKGSSCDAVVQIASPNGVSVAFEFDAMLGGYAGSMPALWDGEAYRDLIEGEVVDVELVEK